jgi:hypothetical protein
MFALIRTYDGLNEENRDEAASKANEGLRAILQQSPGFVSYELLKHDGGDGKIASSASSRAVTMQRRRMRWSGRGFARIFRS